MSSEVETALSLFHVSHVLDQEDFALDLFVAAGNAGEAVRLWRGWLTHEMGFEDGDEFNPDRVMIISAARVGGHARALLWFTDVNEIAGAEM